MSRAISTKGMSKEEWLAARKPFLGASEIGTALGLNDYQTPFDLWRDKIGDPTFIPFMGNERTKWGNRLEDSIAQGFAEDYNVKIQKDNKIRIHENGITSCSLDRVIVGADRDTPGILEIKNMGDYAYNKLLKDDNDIPLFYYSQHQQQFSITGYNWGYFVMLIGGNNLVVKEMVPDPDYIERQNAEAVSWWEDFVVKKVPPPFVVKDLKNPEATTISDEVKVVDKKFFDEVYSKYMDASKAHGDWEKVKTELQEIMIGELGAAKALEYMGCKIANWRDEKWFDISRFRSEHPEYEKDYKNKIVRKFIANKFKYVNKESA